MTTTHAEMANALRFLAIDAVEKARSGHPGMPMGMADVATVLFERFLKFDPTAPHWADRDRFVLSAGHGSMLLYGLLHLTGYEAVSLDELKNFRQLGSRTAGHPEYGHAPGVETTTGPLGQGLATAVGMAIAERLQAERFGTGICDHHTYVICGDGCLMEGISHEAVSLAGHLKLGKLIVLFDNNGITIDGSTDLAVSDDQGQRFDASGWHVQSIDGHDPEAIAGAIAAARTETGKPSMIACRTIIGYGAPVKGGTAATHGAPLGAEEVAATREALSWPYAPFEVPASIRDAWRATGTRGAATRASWQTRLGELDAGRRAEFERTLEGRLPGGWLEAVDLHKKTLSQEAPKVATRVASQMTLEVLSEAIPELVGGSADLTGSNNTRSKTQAPVAADDFAGSYVHYGVREHAMGAAMNGIAVHGGFIPYGGTFLVFTDYCRPSIRLSALMKQRVVYVMTHDSIGLGEDGPTHQPVEHLASLRLMPNLNVMRPCDAVETAECWAVALQQPDTPTVLALSRQGLATVRTTHTENNLAASGGYVLREAEGERRVTLIATGSEVGLACTARDRLQAQGVATAVISMPCCELFDQQDAEYRARTLRPGSVTIAVEAGATGLWRQYVGARGDVIGLDEFGASAPAPEIYTHFGITAERIVERANALLDATAAA